MAQADRNRNANIFFNAFANCTSDCAGGPPCRRSVPRNPKMPRQWKEFNEWRVRAHQIADLIADLLVFLHIGSENYGLRTQLFGLKHGHGGMHTLNARNIAAGGDNLAPPAANNERLVVQIRIVAFFNGGIKRVAIYMRDAQLEKFVMGNEAGDLQVAQRRRSHLERVPQSRHNVCAYHLGGFSIPLG